MSALAATCPVCVARLEWATAEVPLPRPLCVGARLVSARSYCCVRATLSSGATGGAFVLTRGLDVGGAIERLLAAPALAGDDLRAAVRNLGWDAEISRAAAAIRLACLDAEACELGQPVWRLLGADAPPTARAAAIVGPPRAGEDPAADDLREAIAAAEAGVSCVKLMGGLGDPAHDLARLARVREELGDAIDLALDVNGAWSSETAHAALPAFAAAGLTLLEEPWPYERGLASFDDLPAERPPLAFGEVSASVVELEALIATGAVEHLRVDATVLGGPDALATLAPRLAAAEVAVFPHYWPELHRHLIALVPATSFVEIALPGSRGDVPHGLAHPFAAPRDGAIVAPDAPGFGFELDWERVLCHSTGGLAAAGAAA